MKHWRRVVYFVALIADAYVFAFLVWEGANDVMAEMRYSTGHPQIASALWAYGIIAFTPLLSLIALGLRKP